MKAIKQLIKNIGGNRRPSNSNSKERSSFTTSSLRKRRSLTESILCSATEDTSSRSITSEMGPASDAPWRVEKIRSLPPGEHDWWKEEEEMDTTTEEDTNTSGGGWLAGSSGGMSESMDESVEDKILADKSSTSSDGTPRRFHNCGLETWEVARARWNARPEAADANKKSPNKPPVSQRELGKILTKASTLRTYELPRRVPLNNLIESYVNVWNGDDL